MERNQSGLWFWKIVKWIRDNPISNAIKIMLSSLHFCKNYNKAATYVTNIVTNTHRAQTGTFKPYITTKIYTIFISFVRSCIRAIVLVLAFIFLYSVHFILFYLPRFKYWLYLNQWFSICGECINNIYVSETVFGCCYYFHFGLH